MPEGRASSTRVADTQQLTQNPADVVHQQRADGAAVVGRGDGAEALLARGVPERELDALAAGLDHLHLEVHADRGNIALRVGVVRKAEQQTRFTGARVAEQEQLEEVVVRLGHGEGGKGVGGGYSKRPYFPIC